MSFNSSLTIIKAITDFGIEIMGNISLKKIKGILIYSAIVLILSIAYFIYVSFVHPPSPERETFLSEIGEGFGEIGLWLLVFIYARTVLKLILGKGGIAKRILPDYESPIDASYFKQLLSYLNKTHVYFGIAAVAIILLHIFLVGMRWEILFFPAVLALVVWQGLFGLFLSWKYSPKQLKKLSYLVHAQFITGISIGIFAYLGHVLID